MSEQSGDQAETGDESIVFTVFTPTFNRVNVLHRVYECLQEQTFRNFEWVIIDDGSDDGTDVLVSQWKDQASFPIQYFWQKNGHKKTAFNHAVRVAKGCLFLPWDSDDQALPNALNLLYTHWMQIPVVARARYSGVCGLCVDESGEVVGRKFPANVLDSDALEVFYRHKVHGEKWGFTRTSILRKYPYPDTVSGHVPESVVWSRVAKSYRTRFINEPLRIYIQTIDSVTQAGRASGGAAKNAEGQLIWVQSILQNELRWFLYRPLWFFKAGANFTRFSRHVQAKRNHKPDELDGVAQRLLIAVMAPLGHLLYLRDKLN